MIVSVRRASVADAASISALVRSLARYFLHHPERPEDASDFFLTLAPEAIGEWIRSGRIRYHVADSAARIVGAVGVRDTSHLYHLFVAEDCHGRGIARRLWAVAEADARLQGNRGSFTVNSSLHARDMYQGWGFTPSGPPQVANGIAWVPMVRNPPGQEAGPGPPIAVSLPRPVER